jgi:hypothetical protein
MSPGFDATRRVVVHPVPHMLHALSQGSVAVASTTVSAQTPVSDKRRLADQRPARQLRSMRM